MRNPLRASVALTIATGLILASCGKDESASAPTREQLSVFSLEHAAKRDAAPAEMVALGRDLYHEKRLSTKQNLSCASCHDLARFGQDGEPTSAGSEGQRGGRNSPTSVNAFRQFAQFWDGRAKDVEEQAQGPVLNPIEHGFAKAEDFVAALKGIDGMPARFAAVFGESPDPVTLENFGKAVGAFERTLVTKGRWDDYLAGNDDALTAEEKAGLHLFMTVGGAGCVSCHNGQTVGGGQYRKLGERVPFETADLGRYDVTKNDAEKHFFKVPMLLNVARTGPYFHDGSVATLEAAVRLMGKHQLGVELTDDQVKSIVAFLNALTGTPQWTTN